MFIEKSNDILNAFSDNTSVGQLLKEIVEINTKEARNCMKKNICQL